MSFDWSRYATGGAKRPDSFSGMQPQFNAALQQLFTSAPPEYGLQVGSGFRSIERQRELWNASDKSGRMVARPGGSQHNHGNAADLHAGGMRLDKASPAAKQWVHDNAGKYGLSFPMSWEPWHIELAGARGKKPDAALVASAPASQSALPLPSASGGEQAPQMGLVAQAAPAAEQPAAGGEEVPAFAEAAAQPSRSQSSLNALLQAFGQQQQEASLFSPVQFAGVSPNQANALASLVASIKQGRA